MVNEISKPESKVKKKKPFKLPEYKTYEGTKGSPNQWREAFEARLGVDEARRIISTGNPRTILQVPLDSNDWIMIKIKYRQLVMIHHPDKGGDPEMFKKIQASYELLEAELQGK